MKQKVIGVTVCMDQGRLIPGNVEYAVVRREYTQAIRAAGAQPIMLDVDISPEFAAQLCDGIVISGGFDIPAGTYGDENHESMKDIELLERVRWERGLIDACDAAGKPILGICYGMQLMNVHYGGSLHQDIPLQVENAGRHDPETPIDEHIVTFNDDFLGFAAGESTASAPRHHQAVKQVAEGWEVVARTADGVVEAMRSGNRYGVQWHAESDHTAQTIYGAFVAACGQQEQDLFTKIFDQDILNLTA